MDSARNWIFYGLLIFALIAIISAIMGMCACKIDNSKCFNVCYGMILLPTWLIVIIVGGASVYMSTAGKDKLMD